MADRQSAGSDEKPVGGRDEGGGPAGTGHQATGTRMLNPEPVGHNHPSGSGTMPMPGANPPGEGSSSINETRAGSTDGATRYEGAPPGGEKAAPSEFYSPIPGVRIIRRLGAGAFGEVYEARQEGLERPVALKILKGHANDRFLKEANAVAKMNHPGILQLHTCGRIGDRAYMILEFVGGGTLEERMKNREGKLWDPVEAADLVAKLAMAAGYAHERGVIHRDLKPANILFRETGEPVLGDFGMAKFIGDQNLTVGPVGSPAWIPPEQADANSEAMGPQADVFGLGAILYHLVTGQAPFIAENSHEAMRKSRTGEFPKPRELNSCLCKGLEKIINRAMARQPGDRHPSARALAEDLRRWAHPPRRALLMGALSATALGGLGWAAWALSGGDKKTAGTAVSPATVPEPPLACSKFEVFITRGGRPASAIPGRGTIPCRENDQIHLEADFNRPCHAYLLWVGSDGMLIPVYPWSADGKEMVPENLKRKPGPMEPVARLSWPGRDAEGKRHVVSLDGTPGMETLILVAGPEPVDLPFSELMPGIRWDKGPGEINPNDYQLMGADGGEESAILNGGGVRGMASKAEGVGDPVDQLFHQWKNRFPVRRCIRFAHV